MVSVSTTFSLPFDLWEKSKRYRLNRSEIARKAIAQAVQEIEQEKGEVKA